ncbi:unnamed protein product [Rotaria magnacalcarata]|uniref:Uncharacterized protein n=1 Tax=Rotaria magnacalcarata TaxID=392030 RepID=A0A820K195_9BILA|nr:unnamed protein product [Rotaria magnacalcarata]CAF4334903.1 unnamed protein product [Rotaria magnacalcarata]
MAEAFDIIDHNTTVSYTFRFGTSDKLIHLTQEQLDRFPYLTVLVAHKDDFLSILNENGEYVLSSPIRYTWFMAILHSLTSQNPCTLFNELPEGDNVLDTLQLFDYLCITSFPLPLLKHESLVRSNLIITEDKTKRVEYHTANLLEARQTAAEFIIALSKNEYDLDNSYTLKRIFSLIKLILYNRNVFSSRFRHHALTVVKECCSSLYVQNQRLLPTIQNIAQNSKVGAFMYLYDDDQPLPEDFENTFAWRGVNASIENDRTSHLAEYHKITLSIGSCHMGKSSLINFLYGIRDKASLNIVKTQELLMLDNRNDEKLCINEVQSARSGHFNTLPKRPKVDKFKHRFGPKAQKYR